MIVIAGSIGYTVPRLGLAIAFTIVVTAQFLVAMLLSHFGWFGAVPKAINITQLVGVGSLVLGVWLITKGP
jgi:transporter family-2 protein